MVRVRKTLTVIQSSLRQIQLPYTRCIIAACLKLIFKLRAYFNFPAFRPGQAEAIQYILHGQQSGFWSQADRGAAIRVGREYRVQCVRFFE
jgi:hypothetical protein